MPRTGGRASAGAVRVAIPCTGLGRQRRGFETFTREVHTALRGTTGIELEVYGGGGDLRADERAVWNLPRASRAANAVARLTGWSPYYIEQATFFAGWLPHLMSWQPHLVYFSDLNLGNACWHWRRATGQRFRLLYCNGGPTTRPFTRCDLVQQVMPAHFESAVTRGERADRMFVLPYGLDVPTTVPERDAARIASTRRMFGVPDGKAMLLSVGMLGGTLKRMDVLIDAVASLGIDRPHLVLLGQETPETPALRERVGSLEGAIWMGSLPRERMADAYAAADAFALVSFEEGFGLAYVEAMAAGLPCIAHDSVNTRCILGSDAFLGDTTTPRSVAALVRSALEAPPSPAQRRARLRHVHDQFSWDVLARRYAEMFRACAAGRRPAWSDA